MYIAVVGSRTFNDYEQFQNKFNEYIISLKIPSTEITIISGGAKGADSLAEKYSNEILKRKPIIFKAEWKRYGRAAGAIRNKQIVKACDELVAFWDGESKGTKISIDEAIYKGKIVRIIRV